MSYKRLTKNEGGRIVLANPHKNAPSIALQNALDKLYTLEEKIENGTLVELPLLTEKN